MVESYSIFRVKQSDCVSQLSAVAMKLTNLIFSSYLAKLRLKKYTLRTWWIFVACMFENAEIL